MEQNRYSNAFVERVFQREQASVDRDLIHARADLTSVFEQHQGKDGPAKLDARASLSFLRDGGGGHSRSILHQVTVTGQITKVRPMGFGLSFLVWLAVLLCRARMLHRLEES